MRTVLAALDASAAARPVLETALGFAELTRARVEAVHVRDRSTETPESVTARAGVRLRLLEGPVIPSLLGAISAPDVIAAVTGARTTPAGRRPVGRTSLELIAQASKPVVVVPPEAVRRAARPFRRILVPLEGTAESSEPVMGCLCPLAVEDVEIVVLHVFTGATMPRVLDRPERDLELIGSEFLARHCPTASRIELRTGAVDDQVAAICGEEETDLVVLSWSQDASAGRAAVIREVLGHARVPVLLLPVRARVVIDLDAAAAAAVTGGRR